MLDCFIFIKKILGKMNVGIVTIHRIQNYGSVLQAYALQKFISDIEGCNAEIINYVYPNAFHKRRKGMVKTLRGYVRIAREYLIYRKDVRTRRYHSFMAKYHVVSKDEYHSIESIISSPPVYDVYMTGSDQVWNVKTLFNDPVFYCTFAPKTARKIAYAASFTLNSIPSEYRDSINKRLSSYHAISVREKSGLKCLEDAGLDKAIRVKAVCDPTLLLSAQEYSGIAEDSEIRIEGKYILVYFLDYAFNPHPAIDIVLKTLQEEVKLPLVFIGSKNVKRPKDSRFLFNAGPSEFVYLMKNAEFVVTSSFHGLMFSLIFRKPFCTIVPKAEENDMRIPDILKEFGLEGNAVCSSDTVVNISVQSPYTEDVEYKICSYIKESKKFLIDELTKF